MAAYKTLGKIVMAERIYALSQRIKADKDEMDEVREALKAKMKLGQVVQFNTPEGPHRMKLSDCSETILKDNESIQSIIGTDLFVKVAKIGTAALQAGLKEQCGSPLAENTMLNCIKAIVPKPTLKLLKGKE
jgi:hypothetical protein